MRRAALAALGAILLLAALSLSQGAQAQVGIRVSASSAKVDYPNSITFTLEAEGPVAINQVELTYQVVKSTCSPTSSQSQPEFTPGPKIYARWVYDMRKQLGSLPPGTEIRYQWRLKDAAGNTLQTSESTLLFEDQRHQWRTLPGENFTLYWYQGTETFARALAQAAQDGQARLFQDTGAKLERPVKIYVYGSADELQGALPFPTGLEGGVAFSDYDIVAIGIATTQLDWGKDAMVHELTHLVVRQLTFSCSGSDVTTWLNEGLAMYTEVSPEPEFQTILQEAIREDNLISVGSMAGSFPTDSPQRFKLGYAESLSIVKFLIKGYGRDKMSQLLKQFRQGARPEEALTAVYGFDVRGLDNAWRVSLGLRPRAAVSAPTPRFGAVPTLPPLGLPTPSGASEEATPTP
ncbi:MAG: hypothetical protein HY687_03195, partial [Chloroflexi bacterium]|nr:hypothetical protein [Chloroflexota bacterium]